jgi:hypothetical protein
LDEESVDSRHKIHIVNPQLQTLTPERRASVKKINADQIVGRSFKKMVTKDHDTEQNLTSNPDNGTHHEENTYTLKMSDANEKERRLLRKLENSQKENEKLLKLLKKNDLQLQKKQR